ncbi:DUF3108 domain-containing protein [candidate division NPL-UPA2 bacterium Unc8]|uniref:DUF3108 domain-containing protein n=1 Tax=candidate division NPL-UPA2 bacterium Unc8 TaxID=1980939 RepID=A0A399FWN2_UNCN2|nr:hypothetical protein [Bacillota bacterium]RIH99905.1 MAG: DUF3108 domain-containing protein [candidate division NPL-UPA2 bacterium Unc8]
MKIKMIGVAVFLVIASSQGITLSCDANSPPHCERREFPAGEKLTFRIHFGIPIGTITMEAGKTKWRGQEVYSLLTTSRTSFPISLLYPLENISESLIDKDTLLPVAYRSTEKIRDEKRSRLIVFDREQEVAERFHNGVMHSSVSITPDARDALSTTFYYLRMGPLNVGESIFVNVSTGRYNIEVEFKILERKKWRGRNIIIVESTPEGVGLGSFFEEGSKVQIWFSDDKYRLPLLIRGDGALGLVWIMLINREEG